MNRPNIKDWFGNMGEAHKQYMRSPELWGYIQELDKYADYLVEQYGVMDGRRERAIKSLEESEKQFEQLQEAYNKLLNNEP